MTRRRRRKPRPARRRFLLGLLLLAVLGSLVSGGLWWREASRRARIARLGATRDALRQRLADLRARDPVITALPRGSIAIGVSQAAGEDLIGRLATGILGQVELELRDLRVRKEGQLSGRVLFARMSPGQYDLDARIHEVRAVLGAEKPALRFEGQRIELAQPVRVVSGEGRATVDFHWRARGIANVLCDDFGARISAEGTVVPRSYTAKGSIELRLEDGAIVAVPSFPDLELRLQVEPSSRTWAAVDRVLQERGVRCRTALKLVDVPARLRELLRNGFRVKVPGSVFKPFEVRAGLRREIKIRGETVALDVAPRELTSVLGFIWYGADLTVAGAAHATIPASR
jgi:hypothetical protein